MKLFRVLIITALAAVAAGAEAKVLMPALFSDNMVLQQNTSAAIWGMASGNKVTLHPDWMKEPVEVKVEKGKWRAEIKTPPASFDPHTIKISDNNSEVVIENVLVGEVWICSGQSNMEMTMRGFTGQPINGALEQAVNAACYKNRVRAITVDRKESEKPRGAFRGRWVLPDAQTMTGISATAWYFAEALTRMTDVPVGIITTSRSSSKIEAWMPKELLAEKFSYDVDAINADPDIRGIAKCGLLYNGMLAPVMGYAAKGFLWYQGESNRGDSGTYPELMSEMVRDWRSKWGDKDNSMPFIYVQIAHYAYDNDPEGFSVPEIVGAQLKALDLIPNSSMVTTTDIGEELCIHPASKDVIGRRAAIEACRTAYSINIPDASGMKVSDVDFAGGKVLVTFDNASYGFSPAPEGLTGFELADSAGKTVKADAVFVKNKPVVIVSSPEVPEPVEVRYAYRNFVRSNLVNTLGYPAYPFRYIKD